MAERKTTTSKTGGLDRQRNGGMLATAGTGALPPLLTGIRITPATYCQYADRVRASDLLEVDFDVRTPDSGGGLYLVEEIGPRGVKWFGCRRFSREPSGLRMDYTGKNDWRPIDLHAVGWRVVGCVRNVYRPV